MGEQIHKWIYVQIFKSLLWGYEDILGDLLEHLGDSPDPRVNNDELSGA